MGPYPKITGPDAEPSWAAGHGLRRNDVFLAYLAKQSVRIPFAAATRKETSP